MSDTDALGSSAAGPGEYVLGTHDAELERLGLQHRLWSAYAFECWERAGIAPGRSVLDVGCGPGFTSFDLAALVGASGRVVAVDESARFIDVLRQRAVVLRAEHVESHVMDVQRLDLEPSSMDVAYARWVLFFVRDPAAVVEGVANALQLGGIFAVQDYVSWEALRLSPPHDAFDRVIAACLASFRSSGGDTQIGLRLPELMERAGLEVMSIRSLQRVARAGTPLWHWPDSFFRNYVPLLVQRGLLDEASRRAFEDVWRARSRTPSAFIWAPAMIEILARKH